MDVWGAGEGEAVVGEEAGEDFFYAVGADPLFEAEEEGSFGERGGFSSTW